MSRRQDAASCLRPDRRSRAREREADRLGFPRRQTHTREILQFKHRPCDARDGIADKRKIVSAPSRSPAFATSSDTRTAPSCVTVSHQRACCFARSACSSSPRQSSSAGRYGESRKRSTIRLSDHADGPSGACRRRLASGQAKPAMTRTACGRIDGAAQEIGKRRPCFRTSVPRNQDRFRASTSQSGSTSGRLTASTSTMGLPSL